MPRYALKIEYDGRPFCGWQRQATLPSVQGAIEAALAKLEHDLPSIGAAGRTDTGVHATAQVAHCDMRRDWNPFRLMEALNHHLRPAPVAILACAQVDEGFHARFSATERRYLFRLLARRAPPTFAAGQVWHIRHALQLAPMQQAATHLLGLHDFTTFRASQCQAASPCKTLDALDITCEDLPEGQEFRFSLRARSFLHNQVRSIVGTLERVGAGAWAPEDVKTALDARDRTACGPVSPPDGLYLTGVGYPSDPFAA
ncbi:tRNA pseudouridine(38-40) synthase TruA [Roseinatronobacter alkalisoli]|uniref:tRNA pseudouridine synthase A n=1 Tax=Roseinatronobacter alkalisoli TaxID=3028235 RepID=A0ABT5T7W3_9RHOB|nr:tRNA pseudouridine(38-40) synthase TruA [Roseinatronobacter sp. HJB301]MDD7971220.1 tRNA pseudouridine(38-40) synthase TruA [Roseinatronobacter sp. HJB301]